MTFSHLTLDTWSYGLGSLAYGAFALRLLHRLRRQIGREAGVGRLGTMLAAVALAAAWADFGLAYGMTGDIAFRTAAGVADTLRFGAWYAFLLMLLHPGEGRGTLAGISRLVPVAIVLVLAGLSIQGLPALGADPPVDMERLGLFLQLALAVLALVLVEQLYRNLPGDWLWNAKPLCLGLASAFLFDLYLYSDALLFGHPDSEAAAIRGAVHALAVPLLALSMSRGPGWISRIGPSRAAVLHTATLLMAGGYLLFISAVGYYVRYFGGEWGRALQLALVFAALTALGVLAFSRTMRARLRVVMGKHFFSYRYDYREEWLRFTRTLSDGNSPGEMGRQVIRGLAEMLESPAGALWLKESGQPVLVRSAEWNLGGNAGREASGSPFCAFLEKSGWVINLEEVRCFRQRYDGLELPAWLLEIPQAWLVVPLLVGQELIGFVVLASPRTPLDTNWEVNDLLKTAGRQAASFIARMQATEALLEARKFDAFNRMSAFVVHDLKNILAQLSLLLRNAERHRGNPQFQQDMLMTIEHAVERMRQLMLQLREGAIPPGMPCGVDVAAIIRRIQAARARQGRSVEVQVGEALFTRGHEERIERVISHLVQNALDATEAGGRVWVRLERQGGQARIEIGDTGQGMSADFLRERLFRPFQSTKQSGMGIGAYESFQYVQELGGKILVESEIDKGTRVGMLLPVFDAGERYRLAQREAA